MRANVADLTNYAHHQHFYAMPVSHPVEIDATHWMQVYIGLKYAKRIKRIAGVAVIKKKVKFVKMIQAYYRRFKFRQERKRDAKLAEIKSRLDWIRFVLWWKKNKWKWRTIVNAYTHRFEREQHMPARPLPGARKGIRHQTFVNQPEITNSSLMSEDAEQRPMTSTLFFTSASNRLEQISSPTAPAEIMSVPIPVENPTDVCSVDPDEMFRGVLTRMKTIADTPGTTKSRRD
jgi:hypothetical protein